MHVLYLNYYYDADIKTAEELLDRYHTIPGLCSALLNAGAENVSVVQRFKKDAVQRLGLEGRVHLSGKLPHNDLETLYNSADFFVLGSHYEGSGFALIEAVACGVTPIVTDIPSFRHITKNGKFGSLWKAGKAESSAHAVQTASQRSTDRNTIRAYFEQELSFDAIGKAALKINEHARKHRNE